MTESGQGRTFHFTLVTAPASHHRLAKNAALVLAGAGAALAYIAYKRRKSQRKLAPQSLADAGIGAEVLETKAAVDRLLQQHFGRPEDVLPDLFASFPEQREALNLASRLGILCERHCEALADFTGEFEPPTALDLGCGVGTTTFELARAFTHVIGVDSSKTYVNAAKTLKERGWMRYSSTEEGEISQEHSAVVPEDVERDRVQFGVVSDLCAVPKALAGPYDAVLAANILCRMPDPAAFLRHLPIFVRPGGIIVIASPYDWRETCTPRSKWLGGFRSKDGVEVRSVETLKKAMEAHFELIAEEELPFIVKEHQRKYLMEVSHATVWKRK